MKKKGLIISTVVMVVVLIAALTTTTFAWFSSSATATVEDISMSVGAASNVKIGLANSTGGATELGYQSGTGLSYTTAWTGGNNMLGTSIEFENPISLDVKAGVGTSANKTTMDSDLKANDTLTNYYTGSGNQLSEIKSIEAARVNKGDEDGSCDVIDLQMGILAARDTIKNTFCKITISIPATQTYVGMISALRLEIKVGTDLTKAYGCKDLTTNGDIFGNDVHYSTKLTDATNATENGGNYDFVFYFMIDESDSASTTTVTQFSIRAFICGYDSDCHKDATGTGATIKLEFDGVESGETISDATGYATKWQALTLADQTAE